jgi:FixJ family two-component response regulator
MTQPVVHVVDPDAGVQQLLASWLATAGFESRSYRSLAEFLIPPAAPAPACIIIDAPSQVCALPTAVRLPVVVMAWQADVAMAVKAMKTGAIDFVEKPLCERELLTAVGAAIEVDRRQRLADSARVALQLRFATLSYRERQVMALVTAGRLNKQVGADLGLSEITVKAHRGSVMRKMAARSLADLVRMADQVGDALAQVKIERSIPVRIGVAAGRHIGCSLAR